LSAILLPTTTDFSLIAKFTTDSVITIVLSYNLVHLTVALMKQCDTKQCEKSNMMKQWSLR